AERGDDAVEPEQRVGLVVGTRELETRHLEQRLRPFGRLGVQRAVVLSGFEVDVAGRGGHRGPLRGRVRPRSGWARGPQPLGVGFVHAGILARTCFRNPFGSLIVHRTEGATPVTVIARSRTWRALPRRRAVALPMPRSGLRARPC